MSRPKIGDNVKVISDCMTKGCTGEVKEVHDFFSEITVKLDKTPSGYRGNGVACYNMKSVEVLPKQENAEGTELDIGIFFIDIIDLDSFKNNHFYFDDDHLTVMGHSPFECVEVLNKLIEDGEVGEENFSFLYFKGETYRVAPPKTFLTVEKYECD